MKGRSSTKKVVCRAFLFKKKKPNRLNINFLAIYFFFKKIKPAVCWYTAGFADLLPALLRCQAGTVARTHLRYEASQRLALAELCGGQYSSSLKKKSSWRK